MPGLKPTFVRWFPQDWLLSPAVNMLTLAQQGAYFRLLLHAYLAEDGAIPTDPRELRFMSGGASEADIEAVLQLFEAPLQGRRTHRIVVRELGRMTRESDMQAESGRRGGISSGKSRRGSNKERVASENRRVASKGRSHHDHDHDHDHDRDHSASAPPEGARSREMSTPQSEPLTSPAGSAPAARAEGAAPARPASAAADDDGYDAWVARTTPEERAAALERTKAMLAEAREREKAAAPPPPPEKPGPTREERAAAVRAQAAAIKAAATPEELAEVEARLAAQDAMAHPVRPLPVVAEGGDA